MEYEHIIVSIVGHSTAVVDKFLSFLLKLNYSVLQNLSASLHGGFCAYMSCQWKEELDFSNHKSKFKRLFNSNKVSQSETYWNREENLGTVV